MKMSYCARKKYHWNHAITIPEYLRIIFHTVILFIQPNVNSINSYNANFKKQRESVANQISNKAKNTNHSLDIEELINLRKLHTNNLIIGYLNINSLRNKIAQLRLVCRKAPINLLCMDETKLDASFLDAQFHIEGYHNPSFRRNNDKNVGGK